jgi:hypothetical protein
MQPTREGRSAIPYRHGAASSYSSSPAPRALANERGRESNPLSNGGIDSRPFLRLPTLLLLMENFSTLPKP